MGRGRRPGTLDITRGTLLPGQTRRVVVRLHCRPCISGEILLLGVAACGDLPEAAAVANDVGVVEADPVGAGLCLTSGRENNAQRCDPDRSLTVVRVFDNLPHDLLLKALRKNVQCKWALLYIERWLTAPMEEEGERTERTRGTPQGA